MQGKLYLGNLDAKRDWGYAEDYVEAMWFILQQDEPEDYVIATGETHSVREFVEKAFYEVGITITWEGSDVDEVGMDAGSERILVEIDPRYFRPTGVDILVGDATKARKKLGWEPRVTFEELIRRMIREDCREAEKDELCGKAGYQTYNQFECYL